MYRDNAVAHRAGKQLVLRLAFAESGKHFNHIQTILSAFVATDRRGNERGVNVSKQSCGMSNGGFSRAPTVNRLMLPGLLLVVSIKLYVCTSTLNYRFVLFVHI